MTTVLLIQCSTIFILSPLYVCLSAAALYEMVPPPGQAVVRLRPSTSARPQRPVSIVKASSMEEQERNREELRNLDHREVGTG